MRVTLDSNVLVYAALEPQTEKGRTAARLIADVAADGVLAAQALGEFINVIRRRAPNLLARAIDQVDALRAIYIIAPTDGRTIHAAATLSLKHHLQFWDAVIFTAASEAGARLFLSEDLQDGLTIDGMRVLNPFRSENDGEIEVALGRTIR